MGLRPTPRLGRLRGPETPRRSVRTPMRADVMRVGGPSVSRARVRAAVMRTENRILVASRITV